VRAAVERCVAEHGGIDVMVANVGLADVTPLLDVEEEIWRRVLDVNLTGAFICTQEAGRAMVAEGGGAVVITSSTNGFHPEQNLTAYNAAKGGVINFVRAAALDLARRGIRVNGIAPGFVRTPRAAWMTEHPDLGPAYLATIPMGRWGEPEDMADVVSFLCSHDARYMTGQTLVVDGGHTLGVPLPDLDVPLDRGGTPT
jgi:3-oxoacyl-[acyl-carrier protein] reductase